MGISVRRSGPGRTWCHLRSRVTISQCNRDAHFDTFVDDDPQRLQPITQPRVRTAGQTSGCSLRLVQQISRRPCELNVTYGLVQVDERQARMWVRGCRGVFKCCGGEIRCGTAGSSPLQKVWCPCAAQVTSPWLVVVSIASEARPHYWRAQQRSWGQRAGAFLPIVERDVQRCDEVACASAATVGRVATWRLHQRRHAGHASRDEHAYVCAQRRPLQAIRLALRRVSMPTWLLVVDDDTFVDVLALEALLLRLQRSASPPLFLGAQAPNDARRVVGGSGTVRASTMALGGAGYVLHREALRRLLGAHIWGEQGANWGEQGVGGSIGNSLNSDNLSERGGVDRSLLRSGTVQGGGSEAAGNGQGRADTMTDTSLIDACVHEALSGRWCGWNSDWAVAECLALAEVTISASPAFTQWKDQCKPPALSCHPVDDVEQYQLTVDRLFARFMHNVTAVGQHATSRKMR